MDCCRSMEGVGFVGSNDTPCACSSARAQSTGDCMAVCVLVCSPLYLEKWVHAKTMTLDTSHLSIPSIVVELVKLLFRITTQHGQPRTKQRLQGVSGSEIKGK